MIVPSSLLLQLLDGNGTLRPTHVEPISHINFPKNPEIIPWILGPSMPILNFFADSMNIFWWKTHSSLYQSSDMIALESVMDLVLRDHPYIPTCWFGHSYLDHLVDGYTPHSVYIWLHYTKSSNRSFFKPLVRSFCELFSTYYGEVIVRANGHSSSQKDRKLDSDKNSDKLRLFIYIYR